MFGFKNHWRKEKVGRCPKCNAVNENSHKALEKFLTEGPPETPSDYANKEVMREWIRAQDKLLHTLHRVLMSSITDQFIKHELEEVQNQHSQKVQ